MVRGIEYSYIIMGCGGYYEQMFKGVDDLKNCQYCYGKLEDKRKTNVCFRSLYRVTTSAKFERLFGARSAKILEKHWMRHEYCGRKIGREDVIFLFLQNNKYAHNETFLAHLKKCYPRSKSVFWLTNTLKSYPEDLTFLKKYYNLVVTFNKTDATENGFYYHEWCYKEIHTYKLQNYDLFFCGWDKGRGQKLVEIFEFCSTQGLKCDFTILKQEKDTPIVRGIRYSDTYINYDEVLARMLESRCILELLPRNSDNVSTLRAAEAIALSKKLLTNNSHVACNSFYKDEQIRVFSSIKDIDINWITDDSTIGFADASSISPERFLNDIRGYLLSKEVSKHDINK